MDSLKIGDIVYPLESSNNHYSLTNKRRGWVGVVTEVEANCFTAVTIRYGNGNLIGQEYAYLSAKYFTKTPPVEIQTNNTNNIKSLF